MKILSLSILLFGIVFQSVGQNSLLGTWKKTSTTFDNELIRAKKRETITFYKDSTVSINETFITKKVKLSYSLKNDSTSVLESKGKNNKRTLFGTFSTDKDTIQVVFENHTRIYSYQIVEGTLTLAYNLKNNSLNDKKFLITEEFKQ
jgi:hypothetical protein